MKRIGLSILAMTAAVLTFAAEQVTFVRGKVAERGSNHAVEFANVLAYDAGRKIAASCPTDEKGEFRLEIKKSGEYKVLVSFIGYKDKVLEIKCEGKEINLGRIVIEPGKEEIAGAGIEAKALIRREIDRVIYDVEADPDAAKMNMAAFMSKIPGLATSSRNGNLEYKGLSMGNILIDDEENFLINKSRQYPMSFIKANYMSSIELVMPNSPEYNNKQPILIIRLKDKLPYGVAGQLSGTGSTLNRYSGSPDLVFNTPIVGVGLSYDYNWSKSPELTDRTLRTLFDENGNTLSTLESETVSSDRSNGHKIGLVLSRPFLKDKLNVKVSMNATRSEDVSWSSTESLTTLADGSTSSITSAAENRSTSPFRINGGMDVRYEIRKGLRATAKYTFRNNSSNRINTITETPGGEYINTVNKVQQEHNASLVLEFNNRKKNKNRWNAKVFTGYMFRDYFDEDFYGRTGKTGGMDYTQGVAYARVNGMKGFLKNRILTFLTLNIENVNNKGVDKSTGNSLDYNDFRVSPSISVNGRITQKQILGISYNFSARRPNPDQLNPYIDDSNPYNVKVGNPNLRGEFTHNISGNYSIYKQFKWWDKFDLNVGYSITPNAIESISTTSVENITTTTYENIGKRDALHATLNMNFVPVKNLSVHLSIDGARNTYSISDKESNSFWSFGVRESLSWRLPWFTLTQRMNLTPYGLSAQSKDQKLVPDLSMSVSRYWDKYKFGVSIDGGDLLHGRSDNMATRVGTNFIQNIWKQRLGRSLSIRAYWRFGKFKNQDGIKHESYDM